MNIIENDRPSARVKKRQSENMTPGTLRKPDPRPLPARRSRTGPRGTQGLLISGNASPLPDRPIWRRLHALSKQTHCAAQRALDEIRAASAPRRRHSTRARAKSRPLGSRMPRQAAGGLGPTLGCPMFPASQHESEETRMHLRYLWAGHPATPGEPSRESHAVSDHAGTSWRTTSPAGREKRCAQAPVHKPQSNGPFQDRKRPLTCGLGSGGGI